MKYNLLGLSDLKVSQVGLGTMGFGWRTDRQTSINICKHALDQGVNLIDTSNSYAEGKSEAIVSDLLNLTGRHSIILSTKFRTDNQVNLTSDPVIKKYIRTACERSLKIMHTDFIDIYTLHYPDYRIPLEDLLGHLMDLKQEGKIRHIGISNFSKRQLLDLCNIRIKTNPIEIAALQMPLNLFERHAETNLLPILTRNNIGRIGYSPLCEGLLTGKYNFDPFKTKGRYNLATKNISKYRSRLNSKNISSIVALHGLAKQAELELAELNYAWLFQTGLDCVLVGPGSLDHLVTSFKGLKINIPKDLISSINRIFPPGHSSI